MARRMLLSLLNGPIGRFVLGFLERVAPGQPGSLRILTYHRLESPDLFDQQMRFIAERFHVISMQELFDAGGSGSKLPPNAVMITFDDAYEEFADHAWPILRRYQLPVTLFVPTAFPDNPDHQLWWDKLHHALTQTSRRGFIENDTYSYPLSTAKQRKAAYKQLRIYLKSVQHHEALAEVDRICQQLEVASTENDVLSWERLRQLAAEGVTLGAHTRNHPLLTQISLDEAVTEAVGSLADLENEIGDTLPIFAYPSGGHTKEIAEALKQAGFAFAFTTERGTNNMRQLRPQQMHRNNITPYASLSVLRAWLLIATVNPKQLLKRKKAA